MVCRRCLSKLASTARCFPVALLSEVRRVQVQIAGVKQLRRRNRCVPSRQGFGREVACGQPIVSVRCWVRRRSPGHCGHYPGCHLSSSYVSDMMVLSLLGSSRVCPCLRVLRTSGLLCVLCGEDDCRRTPNAVDPVGAYENSQVSEQRAERQGSEAAHKTTRSQT